MSMDYRCTVERKATYLHFTGTGKMSEDNARRFLLEAYQTAVESECDSILLEMRFTGSLDLGSIFSVITDRSSDGRLLKQVAYVDANVELGPEAAEFATLVARNRGVRVRLFDSIEAAEQWLSPRDSRNS
ncbi:MAG: hypothetical protein ABW110_04755 [Steroidobacteraceae bacterium]